MNSESATEISRRLLQDRLDIGIMGGLFPERVQKIEDQRILDLGCGPGGWAIDVARAYPQCHVVGMDCEAMIEYGQSLLGLHGIKNIEFKVMRIGEALPIGMQSVDLVNLHFGVCSFPFSCLPSLMEECVRVLRPGGMIRVLEEDHLAVTNSEAQMQFRQCCMQLFLQHGKDLDLGEKSSVEKSLRDIGCKIVEEQSYTCNVSFGTPWHESYMQHLTILSTLLIPHFLESMEMKNVVELQRRMFSELREENFRGTCSLLLRWANTENLNNEQSDEV